MAILRWMLILGFTAPLVCTADISKDRLRSIAQEYFLLHPGPKPLPPDEPGDPPNAPWPPSQPPSCKNRNPLVADCMRAVCDKLSSFECNTTEKLDEVSCQCSGVRGDCVTAVCNHLSRFNCDERQELFGILRMCRGVRDVSCIDYVCSRLSRFECDEVSEMKKVTEICRR